MTKEQLKALSEFKWELEKYGMTIVSNKRKFEYTLYYFADNGQLGRAKVMLDWDGKSWGFKENDKFNEGNGILDGQNIKH